MEEKRCGGNRRVGEILLGQGSGGHLGLCEGDVIG